MTELLPYDSFWSQQRDRLIGEALLNRNGKEYSPKQLRTILVDLQERGPLSTTFRDLLQCKQTFIDSGGRVVRYLGYSARFKERVLTKLFVPRS